jgi:hypothetical protein
MWKTFLSTVYAFSMGKMPLALTVSMYSDLVDLRATGAGLVDMVASSLLLLIAARVYHTLHVKSLFHASSKISLGFQTQDVVVRSMK